MMWRTDKPTADDLLIWVWPSIAKGRSAGWTTGLAAGALWDDLFTHWQPKVDDVRPEPPDAFTLAKGVLADVAGDEAPEDAVRRMRDGVRPEPPTITEDDGWANPTGNLVYKIEPGEGQHVASDAGHDEPASAAPDRLSPGSLGDPIGWCEIKGDLDGWWSILADAGCQDPPDTHSVHHGPDNTLVLVPLPDEPTLAEPCPTCGNVATEEAPALRQQPGA